MYAQYSAAVTFTNDDLMLKTTEHNRPNYVIGEIDNHKGNRILLDPGSSVSLLPLATPQREPTKAEVKAKMFPKTAERSKPASKLQSRPESSAIPSSKNDECPESAVLFARLMSEEVDKEAVVFAPESIEYKEDRCLVSTRTEGKGVALVSGTNATEVAADGGLAWLDEIIGLELQAKRACAKERNEKELA